MLTTRLQRSLLGSTVLLAATGLWRAAAVRPQASLGTGSGLLHGLWLIVAVVACTHIALSVAHARRAGEPFSAGWLIPTAILGTFLPVIGITLLGFLLTR